MRRGDSDEECAFKEVGANPKDDTGHCLLDSIYKTPVRPEIPQITIF